MLPADDLDAWFADAAPLCGAKANQDCTEPGEPGGEAVSRDHGHHERIMPIVKEREAAAKAKKARGEEDQRTGRGTTSLVPAYKLMKISCPVCHAKPNGVRCPPGSHQARRDLLMTVVCLLCTPSARNCGGSHPWG
ncbi:MULTISPECIES: hypothetical protein [Streptomyces]|nr:hypothetical protein OG751_46015 [Streptomyces antimycoticus]WTB11051.1 hypothetical protein OG546_47305 [Streptomyces antimycoticus]